MALSICPKCKEAILVFDTDQVIKCSKCETVFEIESNNEDSNIHQNT